MVSWTDTRHAFMAPRMEPVYFSVFVRLLKETQSRIQPIPYSTSHYGTFRDGSKVISTLSQIYAKMINQSFNFPVPIEYAMREGTQKILPSHFIVHRVGAPA